MPNFKRIGGGPWKNGQKSDDLTWNDPYVAFRDTVPTIGAESVALNCFLLYGDDGCLTKNKHQHCLICLSIVSPL